MASVVVFFVFVFFSLNNPLRNLKTAFRLADCAKIEHRLELITSEVWHPCSKISEVTKCFMFNIAQ